MAKKLVVYTCPWGPTRASFEEQDQVVLRKGECALLEIFGLSDEEFEKLKVRALHTDGLVSHKLLYDMESL